MDFRTQMLVFSLAENFDPGLALLLVIHRTVEAIRAENLEKVSRESLPGPSGPESRKSPP